MAGCRRPEHRLGEDQPLDAKFVAAGFDAVIIVGAPPAESAEILASLLSSQAGLRALGAGAAAGCAGPPPAARGPPDLHRLYGKQDRPRAAACAPSRSPRASKAGRCTALRSRPDFEQLLQIRLAHDSRPPLHPAGRMRRHVQDLSGGERARREPWWCSRCSARCPDVSERIVGFDRFLQEYEIVAGLNHPNIVRIYDLGHRRRSCLYRHGAFPGGRSAAADEGAAGAADGAAFSRADRERARRHSRRGRAAPGLEARQRDAARRRLAVPDRFRSRQGQRAGCGAHGFARDLRHSLLHEPGARSRRADRRAQRSLQPGRRVLRDADRPQALHRDRPPWKSSTSTSGAELPAHRAAVRRLRADAASGCSRRRPRTGFSRRASCSSAVAELKVPA